MSHALNIDDRMWERGQRISGQPKPGAWFRALIAEALIREAEERNPTPTEQAEPPRKGQHVRAGYVGDYWFPGPLRHLGSNCNACKEPFPLEYRVVAQHYQYDNGARASHYFHPFCTPRPGASA